MNEQINTEFKIGVDMNLPLRLVIILILCAGSLSCKAFFNDTYLYGYVLKEQDDSDVCLHMQGVYNNYFKNPWNHSGIKKINGIDVFSVEYPKLYRAIYTLYPTSQEYSDINWQIGKYKHKYAGKDKGYKVFIYSVFDINNDGKNEVVIKNQFLSGPDGFENLLIFQENEIKIEKDLTLDELYTGRKGKSPPRIIGGAKVIRPFKYKGKYYISRYVFDEKNDEVMFGGPEFLNIIKYHSGGRVLPGYETRLEIESVCEYKLIHVDAVK